MKAGDYVRTKKYGIGKVLRFYNSKTSFLETIETDILDNFGRPDRYISYDSIIKSSPNIIDLIEVGDFITYEKDNIYINIPTSVNGVFDETTLTIVKMVDNEYLKDVNIKSIITHEQIDSVEYKVKE